MAVSTKIDKIIMGKHMIVACIILSSLYINVAGNDVPTYLHKLNAMQKTLKSNIFQRKLLEKRYADDERKKDKIMHAINHAEDQTEFQRQNHIDNIVSTNNVEKGNMKKVDTLRAKFTLTALKVENVTTHAADQINKREPIDDNTINWSNVSYSSCHVKQVCKDQPYFSDPCSTIISRAVWYARNTKDASYMEVPVEHIFIHHTAMDRCYSLETCTVEMMKIQNFHMDDRGWDDIGCSFLVGDDGNAYEARGWDRVGAHTRGWNSKSISIAVMGNFNHELPCLRALKAIDRLISCGILRDKVLPYYSLHGHRGASVQFDSPGHMFYDRIKKWSHYTTFTS